MTISVAESLTGGMFQEQLTTIPGVSQVFRGGVVSYATDIKAKVLHVSDETISQHGVD